MKARLASVVAIALLLTLGLVPAHAVVKAGVACKKVGSTAIAGAYKYTCVKSGKKLIWNKGVKVPAAKPTPTPTPTPTPAPTPTPTPTSTPTPTPTSTPTPTQSGVKSITRAEVAVHNKESDCWTYVDNKVYDLSKWLPDHPGGAFLVLSMCGVDGAAAFRDHHKTDQDNALTTHFIGDLK